MVYCSCEKTNHKRSLACTYYNLCLTNSKKNLLNLKQEKNVVRGLSIRCLRLFFHLLRQERQTCFERSKSCLDLLISKRSVITHSWPLQRSLGAGFGPGFGK